MHCKLLLIRTTGLLANGGVRACTHGVVPLLVVFHHHAAVAGADGVRVPIHVVAVRPAVDPPVETALILYSNRHNQVESVLQFTRYSTARTRRTVQAFLAQ